MSRHRAAPRAYAVFGTEIGGPIHALSSRPERSDRDVREPHPRRDPDAITEHEVILFMKGTPEQPMCGFSARTARP